MTGSRGKQPGPAAACETVHYDNGEVYEGELKDDKRHGRGVYRDSAANVYDGEWKDDWMHGAGTIAWATGDIYEGQWVEGKPHGWGSLTSVSGDVYEGLWSKGKKHGRGTLVYASGDVYEGSFNEGECHGEGTMKYSSGGMYEGIWTDGQRTQVGAMTWGKYAHTGQEKRKVYNLRELRSQQSQQGRLKIAEKKCESCGVDDCQYKLRVCSGCGLALYCSAACQKAARRSHQRICNIIAGLPPRDADRLVLEFDREKGNDFDAGLRYATKYMDNLKHLAIDLKQLRQGDAIKLSAKHLSSLFRSKKEELETVSWENNAQNGFTKNGNFAWALLRGLKQLCLEYMQFRGDVQLVQDIIHRQRETVMVLCLPYLGIDWSKAKSRRTIAQAISACNNLVRLDLGGGVLMDSDLKVMLQNLPDLRILNLARCTDGSYGFTDNTCSLIARKCPGLQELSLSNHNHLSARGIRKIFEGCVHLRSFCTTTRKLSCDDARTLLEIAPQLLCLVMANGTDVSTDEVSQIIEATGGRTVLCLSDSVFEPDNNMSAKAKDKYERQREVLVRITSKVNDPEVANAFEEMFDDK